MWKQKTLTLARITVIIIMLMGGTAAAALPTGAFAASSGSSTSMAAWDCPSGHLCIWDGYNGTGNRCAWSNADNDWYSSPDICSWVDSRPYKSIYNRGTSSSYWGVTLYDNADYSGWMVCYPQGTRESRIDGSVRSHRWERYTCW
ncbi:peptidase inhibitor family I36 protein [Sphaerisporangium melleum]